ncbi:FMN-binding negative transcriptional regulator [Polymorphobacter fuscus]|uniref:FMN-binding negative transcriptional regulator n=1 Tax=Sandarakinorhabdus fusca TaxID=1439888 RepID=A0A7C9KKC5_9SPHN|nr:FMN-binding negative transcriptional regulator [Polymorphobacter fuscus]MQT18561.1 FMN-binding negative transcriptional regulator [Polymorphobacter fuscus]
MHPNAVFRFPADREALAFVADVGFAHLFAMTPDGPRVAHVPLLVVPSGVLRFHLSNGNALARHLDGAVAVASVGGPGSYISPNWYADPANNLPTWNYRTVEIEGRVTALGWDALRDLLDLSAATFEPRVGQDWTMAKMDPGRRDAMMRAITAYELVPTALRSTDKASQNRSEADARAVMAALATIGDDDGAAAVKRRRGW